MTAGYDRTSSTVARELHSNEVLATLQEELAAFVSTLPRRGENAAADRTTGILVKSLHAILEIAASELDDERFDPELLSRLTADRASVLHDVREGIGGGDAPGSAEVRLGLWRSLDAFERLLWLLRRHVWSRCVPVADSAAQRGASTVIR